MAHRADFLTEERSPTAGAVVVHESITRFLTSQADGPPQRELSAVCAHDLLSSRHVSQLVLLRAQIATLKLVSKALDKMLLERLWGDGGTVLPNGTLQLDVLGL